MVGAFAGVGALTHVSLGVSVSVGNLFDGNYGGGVAFGAGATTFTGAGVAVVVG